MVLTSEIGLVILVIHISRVWATKARISIVGVDVRLPPVAIHVRILVVPTPSAHVILRIEVLALATRTSAIIESWSWRRWGDVLGFKEGEVYRYY